jgi:hypothetical protein
VTDLASLDGPAAAAVSEQLVAAYRAAMGAAPFFETEVEAGTDRAWPITHDQDTPARALHRSLGFRQLGHGPLGWRDADRVVLGAELPPASPRGGPQPDPPGSGPQP